MTTIESGIAYVLSFGKHRDRLRETWTKRHPEWKALSQSAFAQAVTDECDKCARLDVEMATRPPRGF